jgi:Protein of unknown function (DUF736)
MAQIGSFTRDQSGAYTGTIKTLTLTVKATIKPCGRDNEKAPDYRVTGNGVEFGAGWSRTARETGARRPVLPSSGLCIPSPGRQGRAQAHLVALTGQGRSTPAGRPPSALEGPGLIRSRRSAICTP